MNDLLRMKGRMTRMLLLLEMITGSPKDQRSLAETIGITPQAVSDYMSRMAEEGLVKQGNDGPRPTMKGVEMVNRDLLNLKQFIDSSIGKLEIIASTDAIANERIEKGARVYLSMKNGLLRASMEGTGSFGVADRSADEGEMLPVSSLAGLMDLQIGSIYMVEIPPARAGGGVGTIDLREVKERCGSIGKDLRIATLDLEAESLFLRSSIRSDLEMVPPQAILESVIRGLDVIAFGTPYSISIIIRFLEERNYEKRVERITITPDRRKVNHNE